MTKHIHIGVAGFFFVGLSIILWGILFRLLEHGYAQQAWAAALAWVY